MGRARIPLEQQTGHLTVAIRQQKEYEEQLVQSAPIGEPKPPTTLINAEAKRLWYEAVRLMKTMPLASELDLYNVEGMCNAWAAYRKASRALKKSPLVTEDGKPDPLINVQIKYAEEFRAFARNCGFTVDSRLKLAATAAKKADDELADEFGDI